MSKISDYFIIITVQTTYYRNIIVAQRDYAARSGSRKKKSGVNKSLLLTLAIGIVLVFGVALYLLKEKAPEPVVQKTPTASQEEKHKSQLPSRIEETFSYIKELESRSITHNQPAELNASQKAELKRLQEEEQARQAALEKLKQAEAAKAAAAESAATQATANVVDAKPAEVSEESKLKAEQERQVAEKKLAEQRKAEQKKAEQAKAEQAKAETAKKAESKKTETPKNTGKFGLQCGAFNDRAKAESLQARLAMAGLNARITESGKWNRVVVGPIGDRPAAVSAQQQASSITGCVVIGM
ncbi:cell division protein FtsN [Lonepinella sp. BR2271]|uniref:cell division protein FtsN n=1 Tax=Lonepinella sp. BR2271 TaxID=3434550 RepID=UPI003F6E369A